MSEKFNEQHYLRTKWCLLFKHNLNLETKFQHSSWKAAYAEMKICHLFLIILLIITMIINMYLHIHYLKNIKKYSESERIRVRSNYWMLTRHPIVLFVLVLELSLCKFNWFSRFRGVVSVVILFSLVADCSTYIYPKLELLLFGTFAIYVFLYIYWVAESIICNWIIFGIAYIVGYSSFTAIVILRERLDIPGLLVIFSVGILAVHLSRQREIKKRREYFILVTVKKREEELENLISMLPLGIAILDEDEEESNNRDNTQKIVKYSNTALTEILQEGEISPRRSTINSMPSELIIREENKKVNNLISHIYSTRNILTEINGQNEISYETNPGNIKDFKLNKIEIEFQNKKSIGIIVEDLTIMKEIERDKLREEFDHRLIRTISHEIRTPLNSIQGSIQILETVLDRDIIQEYKKYFQAMKSGVVNLQYFVDGIFELSNKEPIVFEYKTFNIVQMLEDVKSLFSVELEGTEVNIYIELEWPSRTGLEIIHDEGALTQILYILTGNSVKYSIGGSIRIGASYNLGEMKLWVKDEGIGIPEAEQIHLFRLYGNSLNSEFGTGLGLTLCKKMVDNMGGIISLQSEVNVGTSVIISIPTALQTNSNNHFLLSLPSLPDDEGNIPDIPDSSRNLFNLEEIKLEVDSPSTITMTVAGSENSPQILIVDDMQSNRFILKGLLGLLGLKADEAQNGLIALQKIKENPYRVILMDCNMPIMDGYEATRNIQQLIFQGEIQQCLVIGVTAYSSSKNTQLCYDAGMQEIIFKPVSKEMLKQLFARFDLFQDIIK